MEEEGGVGPTADSCCKLYLSGAGMGEFKTTAYPSLTPCGPQAMQMVHVGGHLGKASYGVVLGLVDGGKSGRTLLGTPLHF